MLLRHFKMKYSFLTLMLLAGSLFTSGASAAVSDGTIIPASTLAPLAAWVEQATHVSMTFLPMAIASDRKLEKALHVEDAQHAGAVGAYIPGRLIISNTIWDPKSLESQSYIIHELVHHAQLVSGKTYVCHAAKEREAYMLQSAWLVEHHLKPLVTQAWIDSMSSCDATAKTSAAN